jgi:UDP-3-O-[3-hydroxymyristoyl] glucosamine N-acyltransferase
MEFSAKNIAAFLNGTIEGNPDVIVTSIAKIEDGKPGDLSFLSNLLYEKYLYCSKSSIILINNDFKPSQKVNATLIRVENAYQAFADLLELYQKTISSPIGIESPSFIDNTALVNENVYIGAFSYIAKNATIGKDSKIYPNTFIGENVKIGENTLIFSGARIYHNCVIGNNCIIHSNTVIGSDGFGFAPQQDSNYKKVPQIGNVIIEDFVEIGSNTCIDRATMGSTIIRKGVKLDNLIQIGHNVEIGENTVIAAQSGIAGSSKVGKNCMIGGQCGIVGHISIADEVKIAAQSGISNSITKKGEIVQGSPAFSIKNYQKSYVVFKNLPDLQQRINQLHHELELLKELHQAQ